MIMGDLTKPPKMRVGEQDRKGTIRSDSWLRCVSQSPGHNDATMVRSNQILGTASVEPAVHDLATGGARPQECHAVVEPRRKS